MRLIDANALTYTRCSDNACDSAYDVKCQSCPNAIIRKHSIDNAPTITPDMAQVLEYECGKSNAQPQGKWILVSERLPEEGDYRDCYGLPDGCVLWQTDNGDIGFGWYYHSTECWSDLNDKLIEGGKVIAWQPLPEPYKEDGDEE